MNFEPDDILGVHQAAPGGGDAGLASYRDYAAVDHRDNPVGPSLKCFGRLRIVHDDDPGGWLTAFTDERQSKRLPERGKRRQQAEEPGQPYQSSDSNINQGVS